MTQKKRKTGPLTAAIFLAAVLLFPCCTTVNMLVYGKIDIFYPDEIPVVDIDKKESYINDWIVGCNTEDHRLFIKGALSPLHFDRKRPMVKAQAGNMSIVWLTLSKGTGKYEGKYVFEGQIPIHSPGKITVVLQTLRPDESVVARREFDVYSVGIYSPETDHAVVPEAEFIAVADRGRVEYFGRGSNKMPASMMIEFDKSKAQMPVSSVFKAEPGAKIKMIFADRTECTDFEFGRNSEVFIPLEEPVVPADGFFRIRLKPVYLAKSYVPMYVTTETSNLKLWKLYFGEGAAPEKFTLMAQGSQQYRRLEAGKVGYINVSLKKMYGPQTLKLDITETRYGFTEKEIDRSVFYVGSTIGNGPGREFVHDPYYMFTMRVPETKTKKKESLVIYVDDKNTEMMKDLDDYMPLTPVYEPYPGLSGAKLANRDKDIRIEFYITEQHLTQNGKNRDRSALVICREFKNNGKYVREVMAPKWDKNTLYAMVSELDGYYYVADKSDLK